MAVRKAKVGFKTSPAHQSQKRIMQLSSAYLFANFPYVFLNKWGISDKPQQRVTEVDKSTHGFVGKVAHFKIYFAWGCEQMVHFAYQWANIQMNRKASGKSEWFMTINPVVFALTYFAAHHFGLKFRWEAMVYVFFSPPIWLDGLFWLLVFAAWRVVFLIGLAFLILYILKSLPQ